MRLSFTDQGNPKKGQELVPPLVRLKNILAALALLGAMTAGKALADQGAEGEQIEAIFAKTSNGYVRLLRPDGSFQPETYKFGKGEYWGGDFVDASIDRMTVDDVARAISPALATQGYIAAKSPDPVELFIVINWGTTVAPEYRSMDAEYERIEANQMRAQSLPGPSSSLIPGDTGAMNGVMKGLQAAALNGGGNSWDMGGADSSTAIATTRSTASRSIVLSVDPVLQAENQMWAKISEKNAQMLGYDRFFDSELQRYRYFVVLLAFDNRTISQKKPKLLWEARLSITQHRNLFDKALGALASNASAYFGQDSRGLVHKAVPVGSVRIGRISSLDFPTKSDAAALEGGGDRVAYLRREGSENGLVIVELEGTGSTSYSKIPGGETPTQVVWCDSGHIRVTFASATSLSFGTNARTWSEAATNQAAEIGANIHQEEMQARVDGEFPHRKVVILGSDRTGRRYLLAVSGAKAALRYYIFDSRDDILVDVGRSGHNP